ncbi:MAG: hypothetical protein ACLQQ4_05775, partial [Bacteroidia bacterium]
MQTFTKKVLLAFSLLVFHFMLIKGQAPYTAQFTTVNGTQFSPTDAHICPSNGGYATLKAYAEWPFGVGYQSVKYLYISEGSTYHIPCGAVVDYDSIRIDSGGTLIIDDYNGTGIGTTTGTPWTIIGCKGSFVLNGMIQCTNGAHHGGTFQLTEPDSTGILNIPSLSITITQQSGGNGGYGQVSGEQNGSTGGNFVVVNPGGNGGTQFNGNGGGGGGGG